MAYRSRYTQDPISQIKQQLQNVKPLWQDGEVFLFGSRARGDHQETSDYDIGYRGPHLPITAYTRLKSALSDLPWKVDVIDFNRADPVFQQIASQHIIPLS